MTTRAEIKDALETIRPRLQAWQIDDALKVVTPLLNRAERTAGTVEVCVKCKHPESYVVDGGPDIDLWLACDSDDCPIRKKPKTITAWAIVDERGFPIFDDRVPVYWLKRRAEIDNRARELGGSVVRVDITTWVKP